MSTNHAPGNGAGLDPASMANIRNLIEEEKAHVPKAPAQKAQKQKRVKKEGSGWFSLRRKRKVQKKVAAPVAAPTGLPQDRQAKQPVRRKQVKRAEKTVARVQRKVSQPTALDKMIARVKHRVLNYRPTKKHIAIAAAVLLVWFRPWLVFGLIFLALIALVGTFIGLGADRFWHWVAKHTQLYARRFPKKAAKWGPKLQRMRAKWNSWMDKLPDGTVDGLIVPDFNEMKARDDHHEEAMARRLGGINGN